jgi:predicted nucleic acid-binding protein
MPVIGNYTVDYLLDTSSILSYLLAEPRGKKLIDLKDKSALTFISLTELYYILWQKTGKENADLTLGLIKSWKLPLLLADEHISLLAGYLKASYHLSLADSYIAAFAFDRDLTLVTKDPHYNILKNEIKILYL